MRHSLRTISAALAAAFATTAVFVLTVPLAGELEPKVTSSLLLTFVAWAIDEFRSRTPLNNPEP